MTRWRFVAPRKADQSLFQKRRQAVFDQRRIAMIDKAGRQTFDQLQGIVDLAQKQGPGVGGQRPAVETSLDPAPFRLSKIKSRRGPVRMHRGHRESRRKCLS